MDTPAQTSDKEDKELVRAKEKLSLMERKVFSLYTQMVAAQRENERLVYENNNLRNRVAVLEQHFQVPLTQ